MDELTPMMSLSTFLAMLFIVSIAGRAIVELIELIEKRKSPSNRGNDRTGERGLTPSQKAIQRYYNTYVQNE